MPHQMAGFMPRRNVLVPALLIVLLITVWTLRIPYDSFPWLHSSDRTFAPSSASNSRPSPPRYPNNVDLSDPDAPFVGWPLQRVCEETTFVPGLVYICDNNSGGIGNIRNYIQTCLRYALEAGATGLTIPRIRKRSDKDLANLFSDFLPFTYMFDEDHFRKAFNTNCPQITLYDKAQDIPHALDTPNRKLRIEEIVPKDFGNRKGCDWKDQNRHTDRFGDRFRKWLQNETHGHPPSKERPRLIRFKWGVLWDWPIYRDGPEFANTFGHVLKFNKQLLKLGNTALKNMHSYAKSTGVRNGDFLGVHLRTENDALGFWPTYTTQSQGFLEKASKQNFKVAYLATGNATEATKFATDARAANDMSIVTKTDLLTGKDLEVLNALSWDQQGLVDFIVLLGSNYFVGAYPSSFSLYLTLKRHLRTGGLYTRPYKSGTEGDGISYLVGRYEEYWEDWLFMWDGMWP